MKVALLPLLEMFREKLSPKALKSGKSQMENTKIVPSVVGMNFWMVDLAFGIKLFFVKF